MTVNQEVYRQLIEMGLPSTLATGAASRFSTAEPAIEWCFGDGQNVSRPRLCLLDPC